MAAGSKKTGKLSRADRVLQVTMAVVGAVVLLGSLGVVLKGALGPQRPALVEVVELGRTTSGDQTVIRIAAVNRGDATAAMVTVEGVDPAGRVASITLDYVPGLSRKAAALTFEGDLDQVLVSLRATGWVDP